MTGDTQVDKILNRIHGLIPATDWEILFNYINNETLTEDRIMKEYESGRKAGIDNENARIKKLLLKDAADYFIAGDNEKANLFRNYAQYHIKI